MDKSKLSAVAFAANAVAQASTALQESVRVLAEDVEREKTKEELVAEVHALLDKLAVA